MVPGSWLTLSITLLPPGSSSLTLLVVAEKWTAPPSEFYHLDSGRESGLSKLTKAHRIPGVFSDPSPLRFLLQSMLLGLRALNGGLW